MFGLYLTDFCNYIRHKNIFVWWSKWLFIKVKGELRTRDKERYF